MARVYFTDDINKAYTAQVMELVNKGMYVYAQTMSGTQGEIAKIDLTDGNDVYRVLMERDHVYIRSLFAIDTMVISVQKYEGVVVKAGKRYKDSTLWNGKGEEVSRKEFYLLGEGRRYDVFTDSKEEAEQALNRRYDSRRCECRKNSRNISVNDNSKKVIAEMAQAHSGYKCVRAKHIAGLEKKFNEYDNSYYYIVRFENGFRDDLVLYRGKLA